MAGDEVRGCVETAEGPIVPEANTEDRSSGGAARQEAAMSVMVGKEAPDFGATAYHEGAFTNVKLSSFRGKWVMLCFYPGDFTFV